MIEPGEAMVRLALAGLLGAAIGIERQASGHLAGMRTNGLVATGAALFTLVGAYGFPELARSANVDPMRVAAQIVSGIGFIGAGAILRDRGSVRGVTTAAALWTSAALGMAVGAGLYLIAVGGAAVLLGVLIGLRHVRDRGLLGLPAARQQVDVVYELGHGTLAPVINAIEEVGGTVSGVQIDDDEEQHWRHVQLVVVARDPSRLNDGIGALAERPEVRQVSMS